MEVEGVLLFGISLFAQSYSNFWTTPTTSPEFLNGRYVSAANAGYSRAQIFTFFFSFLVSWCFLIKITKGVSAVLICLPYFLNMAPHVCTPGMPSSRPDIVYRPKRRVEDPLLALVVDGASILEPFSAGVSEI